MWSSTNEGQNKGCLDEAIGPIMEMVNDELFSNLMEEKKVAAIVKKTAEASKTVSYNMLELLASRMSKASIGPMLTQLLGNSTLLHSFVIFRVRKTIFGMSGCFPESQGQEMKDLTASE